MPKPITASVEFRLSKQDRGRLDKVSIKPNGEIAILDTDGNKLVPEQMSRSVGYLRNKGAKIQVQSHVPNALLSFGGLQEFLEYDSVFIVDTNTRSVFGTKVSAACFVCIRFERTGDNVRVVSEDRVNVYEFRDVTGNPEMLAVLKIADDVVGSSDANNHAKFAIVSDSNLGSHQKINMRQSPVYGSHYMPSNFVLHYASSDTGREVSNRFMRFCDKQASEYLTNLETGTLPPQGLRTLSLEPTVQYRYMFRSGLEIVNPTVKGSGLAPGSQLALYGMRGPPSERPD